MPGTSFPTRNRPEDEDFNPFASLRMTRLLPTGIVPPADRIWDVIALAGPATPSSGPTAP
ncbi:MAG: hypothetical protein OXI91_16465 [Chloroflexota bacterium]|nr:hypothetical protein [Chloroflexota bacterium]